MLRDAVMSVLKTQEMAGLDLITDGELVRFDPSPPETNVMVDYFARFPPSDLATVSLNFFTTGG